MFKCFKEQHFQLYSRIHFSVDKDITFNLMDVCQFVFAYCQKQVTMCKLFRIWEDFSYTLKLMLYVQINKDTWMTRLWYKLIIQACKVKSLKNFSNTVKPVLNWTLKNPESSLKQTLNKVQTSEIFVHLTKLLSILNTKVGPKEVQFREVSSYIPFHLT